MGKLDIKWGGPYKVIDNTDKGSYTIRNLNNSLKMVNRKDLIKIHMVDEF